MEKESTYCCSTRRRTRAEIRLDHSYVLRDKDQLSRPMEKYLMQSTFLIKLYLHWRRVVGKHASDRSCAVQQQVGTSLLIGQA
jgi:hypothetical protein